MADTTTSKYLFTKPEVGASSDSWGSKLNTDFDSLDKLLGAITTTGSADAYVLTSGQTLTAYVSGQSFFVKWNFTNSGAATLNVDSIGAKNIKKRDASTAVAASDLVSGTYARVTYDGTNFVLQGVVSSELTAAYQPLDATLTALAALSWSSLTPVIQVTSADTVSLTSAPKVTTLELGDATDTTLSRSAAGRLAVEGVDTMLVGKKAVPIPASAMVSNTTNGPSIGTNETTTNKVMYRTLDFDTTTQEGAQFLIPMPSSWNEGTVTFQPCWTAASGSGGVVFELRAVALSDDDALDTAFGTGQTSTDTLITAGDVHWGPESSAITIAGSPAANDLVVFQIRRNVSDGSDTLAVDAKLIAIRLFMTVNDSIDA